MIGVLNDYYDPTRATAAAAWQPAKPPKAGIMVYAANNLKSYTDGVFGALAVTDIREQGVAQGFALLQNYPNPFNPKTVISSQLPVASDVRLTIYDLLGREVAVVVNERRAAGYYQDTFSAVGGDGSGLASGVYVYRLTAGSFVSTKKMILLR
jgi:hypothetical protein